MLKVENLDVFYGDAQALDGVSLEIERGRDRRHCRRQRRRQDLADPHHRRHAQAGARAHSLSRHRYRRLAEPQGLRSRHRPGRRRPPGLSRRCRLPKIWPWAPCCRARGARASAISTASTRCFRLLAERSAPARRHAVGRRAADARHRALPDGRAGSGDVRRAVARSCARRRANGARLRARPQSRGPDLRAGGAERGGLAQARQPRLCAGKRPRHAVGQRRGAAWSTTACGRLISGFRRVAWARSAPHEESKSAATRALKGQSGKLARNSLSASASLAGAYSITCSAMACRVGDRERKRCGRYGKSGPCS